MTMIVGGNILRYQAATIRAHCRLMSIGMNNSKVTRTRMLEVAGKITGKIYKRGQHAQAAEDITEVLND